MRHLWSTENIEYVRRFSLLLHNNGISHSLENSVDTDWDKETYGNKTVHLWIHNEDQIEKANTLLHDFLEDPTVEYPAQITEEASHNGASPIPSSLSKQYLEKKLNSRILDRAGSQTDTTTPLQKAILQGYASKCIVLLCSILFLFGLWNQNTKTAAPPAKIRSMLLTTSPLEKALLYDYPASYQRLDTLIAQHSYDAILQTQTAPAWTGIYPKAVSYIQQFTLDKPVSETTSKEPMFEKISKGQIWRLVTPALLHADILHLFFNMIWLLIIGVQIEARIGIPKYIAFVLIVALISNTMQYLMGGPAFLGFSGVVCGMAFFIRARQKTASWESYQMASATFYFIVFSIGILAGLSLLSFCLASFKDVLFFLQTANTAHLAGAYSGWVLGHLKIFRWK